MLEAFGFWKACNQQELRESCLYETCTHFINLHCTYIQRSSRQFCPFSTSSLDQLFSLTWVKICQYIILMKYREFPLKYHLLNRLLTIYPVIPHVVHSVSMSNWLSIINHITIQKLNGELTRLVRSQRAELSRRTSKWMLISCTWGPEDIYQCQCILQFTWIFNEVLLR